VPSEPSPAGDTIGRRAFLAGVVASAVAIGCSDDDALEEPGELELDAGTGVPPLPPSLPADVFRLGVASGDPLPDAVILWTRLVADPSADDGGLPDQPIPVRWEVATTGRFDDVVASGEAVAEPASGHAVHVDASGLEPDTWYHYRFSVGDVTSAVGRTRTAPEPDDRVDRLRFAFASCQNYQQGFWPAHAHLAEEAGLDLVVFLGDYIYTDPPDRGAVRTLEGGVPTGLAGYRRRYAEYKADPALRAAHAAAPWVCTWDDNEVEGNYAGDVPGGRTDGDRDRFLERRAAAYQAWYEHMPVRVEPPAGPDMRIHRTVAWGDLARFVVLDGRQYRSDQACDVPSDVGLACAELGDDDRTMLGRDQEGWLGRRFERSRATWNVVAQQTVVSNFTVGAGDLVGLNLDQWDGYPAARRRLAAQLRGAENPVVITGDIHAGAVAVVTADPDDPSSPPVAPEIVCPSVSSTFPPQLAALVEPVAAASPVIRYVEPSHRGYVVADVTADRLVAEFRFVTDTTSPDASLAPGSRWEITTGDAEPRPA
jgi:alkaline phosphatase D